MSGKTILVVDDEEHIVELLKYNLEHSGYNIEQAYTGEDAIEIMENKIIDLVLLDLMLPGIDGLEVLKIIKNNVNLRELPVIMLTAKNEELDTVLGLEMGADDYISKPFRIHELLARIKAVIRRSGSNLKSIENNHIVKTKALTINKIKHLVIINDKTMELPHKEFDLLYLLASNPERVFTREHLLESVWGYDFYGETRTVDVHIRNLRKKVEKDDKNPQLIKTIRGLGYKFVDEV